MVEMNGGNMMLIENSVGKRYSGLSLFGFAVSDVIGALAGILFGKFLYGITELTLLCVVLGLACGGIVAAWYCFAVYMMNNLVCVDNEYVNLGLHIAMCLIVGNLWTYVWYYRTTKLLNKTPNEEHCGSTAQLLLCMFVPFYIIYWYYKQGKRCEKLSNARGIRSSDTTVVCVICAIFIPLVASIVMQNRINRISKLPTPAVC